MLLIGQGSSAEQAEATMSNEKRLNLALRSGGYALWDHNFETGESYNSPEMIDIFGADENGVLDFNSFNQRIHPEDKDKALEDKIRLSPFGTDVFQTRYRVKAPMNRFAWGVSSGQSRVRTGSGDSSGHR